MLAYGKKSFWAQWKHVTDTILAEPWFGQHVFLASKSGALSVSSSPLCFLGDVATRWLAVEMSDVHYTLMPNPNS